MTERSLQWIAIGVVGITILFAGMALHFALPTRALTAIESPTFERIEWPPVSTGLRTMDQHFRRPTGHEDLYRLVPDQAGVFWLALIVVLIAGFDYSRPLHPRNLDLLVTNAVAWFLWDVLNLFEQTQAPDFLIYIRTMFSIVAALSVWLAVRSVWVRVRPYREPWHPVASERALVTIATVLTVMSIATVFLRMPDDSSYFSNLGAQRLRERGLLPYGDPLLTGTPGAAYAPGMYVLHASVQSLLGTHKNTPREDLSLSNLRTIDGYLEPPAIVTQLLLATFHLIAVAALAYIGIRWRDVSLGAALVALYCASAAVLGTGGVRDSVMGVTFVSHVIPPAMTLVAFALLDQPAASGTALALAAWTGFYPAFFGPIWLGWQWNRGWKQAAIFSATIAAISVVMFAWVWTLSRPAPGLTLGATIVRDTFGHHTDLAGYGSSPFGLWGQATGVAGFLGSPLIGQSQFTAPFFLLFIAYLVWGGWLARHATLPGLALLTAAAAIGATVWKVHATATYMTWFYPFLLLGFLGTPAAARMHDEQQQ